VDVTDPQGVFEVWLMYSLNEPGPVYTDPNPQFIKMSLDSGNTYKVTVKINTSNTPEIDTVYWKFKVYDFNLNAYFSTLLHWFKDDIGCQNTATATP
jgi:hypothetical protein